MESMLSLSARGLGALYKRDTHTKHQRGELADSGVSKNVCVHNLQTF